MTKAKCTKDDRRDRSRERRMIRIVTIKYWSGERKKNDRQGQKYRSGGRRKTDDRKTHEKGE